MNHKNVNCSLHFNYIQFGSTIGGLGTHPPPVIATTTEVLIIYILSNFN